MALQPEIFALVLAAALAHAAWNAMVKSSGERGATFAVMLLTGGVVSIAGVVVLPLPAAESWIYLLLSVQRRSPLRRNQRTRLYRLTELVGRWSMVDVFVVALLVALVQVGNLATIEPAMGAVAFASVVILTMLAAMSFDPRLIWDYHGAHDANT